MGTLAVPDSFPSVFKCLQGEGWAARYRAAAQGKEQGCCQCLVEQQALRLLLTRPTPCHEACPETESYQKLISNLCAHPGKGLTLSWLGAAHKCFFSSP